MNYNETVLDWHFVFFIFYNMGTLDWNGLNMTWYTDKHLILKDNRIKIKLL